MNLKLFHLHNLEKGKRCFVLSNGPSINSCNLSLLKDEVIISINASPLLERKYDIVAKYYCLSDPRFLEDDKKYEIFNNKLEDNPIVVCRDNFREKMFEKTFESFNNFVFLKAIGRDGFSKNLYKGFYFGSSTTHLALQLAYWLGCSNIYILGLDLSYPSSNASYRFYEETITQVYDYQVSVQLHNYVLAKKVFNSDDKNVYICNRHSWASPYLPYCNFEGLFQ